MLRPIHILLLISPVLICAADEKTQREEFKLRATVQDLGDLSNYSGTVTPVEAAVAGAVAGAVVPDGGAAVPDAGALGAPDPGEQAATTSPAAIRTAAALNLRGPTVWSRLMALTSSRRRGRT